MLENMPPEMKQLLAGLAGLLPTALISRILAHHHLVRLGHRNFWSMEMAWEIPTVIFCGIVGGGIAQYLDVPLMAQHGIVAVVSWLGPRGMEVMLTRWVDTRKGG